MAHEAGKGDSPRKSRDDVAYATGWDRIFRNGKDKDKGSKTEDPSGSSSPNAKSGEAQESKT